MAGFGSAGSAIPPSPEPSQPPLPPLPPLLLTLSTLHLMPPLPSPLTPLDPELFLPTLPRKSAPLPSLPLLHLLHIHKALSGSNLPHKRVIQDGKHTLLRGEYLKPSSFKVLLSGRTKSRSNSEHASTKTHTQRDFADGQRDVTWHTLPQKA